MRRGDSGTRLGARCLLRQKTEALGLRIRHFPSGHKDFGRQSFFIEKFGALAVLTGVRVAPSMEDA